MGIHLFCPTCHYEFTSESEDTQMWVCPRCTPVHIGLSDQPPTLEETLEKLKELGRNSQQPTAAVKHDAGKPDMTLVTYAMLEDAVKVLMFGEKKYARFNYRNPSPNFEQRMLAAVMRHITKHNGGEAIDTESGLPHLAHALATLMMIFDRRANGKD